MYWFSSQTQYCHNVLITQSSGLTDGIVAFFNHHWVKNNSVMDGLIQGLTSREDKWRRRGAKRDIHDVKKVNFVRQRKERDKVVKEVEGCSPFPFLHSFYAMMLSTLSTIITLQLCYPAIGIFRGLLRISLVYIQPITSQGDLPGVSPTVSIVFHAVVWDQVYACKHFPNITDFGYNSSNYL